LAGSNLTEVDPARKGAERGEPGGVICTGSNPSRFDPAQKLRRENSQRESPRRESRGDGAGERGKEGGARQQEREEEREREKGKRKRRGKRDYPTPTKKARPPPPKAGVDALFPNF